MSNNCPKERKKGKTKKFVPMTCNWHDWHRTMKYFFEFVDVTAVFFGHKLLQSTPGSHSLVTVCFSLHTSNYKFVIFQVDLDKKEGTVKFDAASHTPSSIADRIDDMGFPAKVKEKDKALTECQTVINIVGMTCQSCVKNIEGNISGKKGVVRISVSLENKLANVSYVPFLTSPQAVCDAIDDMGFDAALNQNVRISVEGMTCQSCVRSIEGTISTKLGVVSIRVSLEDKETVISYNPLETSSEKLRDMIDDMGFEASLSGIPVPSGCVCTCTVSIAGMTCNSCVNNIEGNVSGVNGVKKISVSLDKGQGVVDYDPKEISADDIADKIDDMGFESKVINPGLETKGASVSETVIRISGMTCNSCVKSIEGKLADFQGVQSVRVVLAEERGYFQYNPNLVTPQELANAVDDMGFDAALLDSKYNHFWHSFNIHVLYTKLFY
jgi:Cu+-exporting ATPase